MATNRKNVCGIDLLLFNATVKFFEMLTDIEPTGISTISTTLQKIAVGIGSVSKEKSTI